MNKPKIAKPSRLNVSWDQSRQRFQISLEGTVAVLLAIAVASMLAYIRFK